MTWPRIFHLFADYALIQATSLPSESVFSSSAETDTKCCNCTNAVLMEALQALKFNYKKASSASCLDGSHLQFQMMKKTGFTYWHLLLTNR
ncbi:hypothetical protein DFH08DRAFT_723582 [Mycena albidolilacea]|uniref:HAT C-terminal dimerisation domain-containing protein n=1 Tax=Mycena albidolilacea TaxID=1033008 RepID=A0AAD6YWM2_9AGAR|nr:hypothetical protein DFH08DRAFT_725291 [Mycena albidolilacea]KAJ7300557.1 hypothetical protein DFH08DRAFT_725223 [Mycena albidolilacea]KAJ7302037.1 hypothetical protein DFH08DRAFT_723582 [Mycena albidolilacea]